MTKAPWAILALMLATALATLPAADAHGTPAAREVDTRVLDDGFESLDYGAANGPAEDGGQDLPVIPLYEGGHDHVALDLREAHDESGEAGLYVHLIFRRGDVAAGPLVDEVTFTVDGAEKRLAFVTEDNQAFTGEGFDWVTDKAAVATYEDGVQGFVSYATLGAEPGATLENIRTQGYAGDTKGDFMPGTYYYDGQEAPDTPFPGFERDASLPGAYTLAGPAELVTLAGLDGADASSLPATVALDVASTTQQMTQVITLTVEAPDGAETTLSAGQVQLGPGENQSVELTLDALPAAGTLRVVAQSDLGGRAVQEMVLGDGLPADLDAVEGELVESGDLEPGQDYRVHMTAPGVFDYHDHLDPTVTGTITVLEADENHTAVEHTVRFDGAFSPAELEVHVGDVVVWTNDADAPMALMGSLAGALGGEHMHGDHDHHDHDHDHGPEPLADQESPGAPAALVLAGVAALAVALRRR